MAPFNMLVERFASRIRATTGVASKALATVAIHVLAKVRAEAAANSADATANHGCAN